MQPKLHISMAILYGRPAKWKKGVLEYTKGEGGVGLLIAIPSMTSGDL